MNADTGIPQPGDRIGGYRLVAELGHGSMGRVFQAVQLSMERVVALKVLPADLAGDAQFVARFLREARLVAAVSSPHVVAVHDAGVADGMLYMCMEHVEGGDLAGLVRRAGGRLPAIRTVELLLDAARGLEALERAGLIHRDIKPANVFVTGDGRAKLGDLGLARDLADASHSSQTGLVVGTPAYMSPEQSQAAEDIDIRCDIFALGATGFRLLTGLDPFPGTRVSSVLRKVRGEVDASLTGPLQQADDTGGELGAIIRRCMRRDRGERFQHAGELVAALTALTPAPRAEQEPTPPPSPPSTRRSSLHRLVRRAKITARRRRLRRALLIFAAVAMTGLVVAFVLICRR